MSAYAVRTPHPNGWWGMVVFVATEATLFGAFVGTDIYLRLQNRNWPPAGLHTPSLLVPGLLTVALLGTSPLMQGAARAASRGLHARTWRLLLAAFAVQVVYLAWQLHAFSALVHRLQPRASSYSSVYVTLLGADHLHVLAGLALSAWLLVRLWSRLTPYRVTGLRAITFYWHAVNVITAVVFLVQLASRS